MRLRRKGAARRLSVVLITVVPTFGWRPSGESARGNGRPQGADLLLDKSDNIGGKSVFTHGDAAIGQVMSSVR